MNNADRSGTAIADKQATVPVLIPATLHCEGLAVVFEFGLWAGSHLQHLPEYSTSHNLSPLTEMV